MKITLIRQDNGSGKETLSVCEAGTLFDKMKTETKAGHITALRGIIHCWKVRMPDTNILINCHTSILLWNIPVPKRANGR